MKKLFAIILSLAMVLSVVVLPAAVNASADASAHYVYKEGLEKSFVDGEGEPLSKNLFLNNIGEYEPADGTHAGGISTKYAHSGTHSYEFRSQKAGWKSAYFPVGTVEEGKVYLVDLYYYVDQENTVYGNGSAGQVAIMACTASNDNFWAENKEEAYILNKPQLWELVHPDYLKSGWHHVSAKFTASQSRRLFIAAGTKDGSPTADIFVDDVTVQEVDANTVVMANKKEYNHMYNQPQELLFAGVSGEPIDYAPERPGYKFGGWYSDADLTKPVTTYSTDVTEVYPLWMSNFYETFDNGLSPYAHKAYSLNTNPENARTGNNSLKIYGTDLQWTLQGFPLTTVNKDATYVMDFWYKAKNGTTYGLIDFVPDIAGTTSIWQGNKLPVGYTQFKDVDANPRAGFLFHPWDCKDYWQHASIKFTVPSDIGSYNTLWFNFIADQTMTAEIYIDDITVIQLAGNSDTYEFCDTFETDNNLPIFLSGTPDTSISYVPVRKDCVFDGWYTDETYAEKITEYSADVKTMYAKWVPADNTKSVIDFDANGGILCDVSHIVYNGGDAISVKNPRRVNYDFAGWVDAGGNLVTTASGALSLKAKWSKVIGFESFYRTNENHMGYMLNVVDTESASGNKSAYYNYSADSWDMPILTPLFAKPDAWALVYTYYYTIENGKAVSLKDLKMAPEFKAGEFYSATALKTKPADFDTAYSNYSYLDDGKFVRLTSAKTFESGKYYENGYGRNAEIDAFAAVGKVLNGRKYTVEFKYKVGENNDNTVMVTPMNYPIMDRNYSNAAKYPSAALKITNADKDGEWHTGKVEFIANAAIVEGITSDTLGLYVTAEDTGKTAQLYIDDVSITETEVEGGKKKIYGDVDNNDAVESNDLVRLKKYLAGQSVVIGETADVNFSGGLPDAADLTRLKKILAGSMEPIVTGGAGKVNLEGIKWAVVGDSLTDKTNGTAEHRYYDIIAEKYGMTTTMLGVGGSGYINDAGKGDTFYSRVSKIPEDSDLVTLFGSCNDNWKPLGNISDTGTTTVMGSMRNTITAIRQRCPKAHIIVISPLTVRGTEPGWTESTGNAHVMVEAQKALCKELGVTFVDIYHNTDLESWDQETVNAYYWHHDGCHPNDYGNEIYYNRIEQIILHEYGY